MPDSPPPANNIDRLTLIRRLWLELQTTRIGSKQYETLIARIRKEADAFRETLDRDDPTKF